MNVAFLNSDLPVNMYCESLEKAQSHTHFSAFFFSVFLRLKSAVDQILQLPSADVVAKRLKMNKKETCATLSTRTFGYLTSSRD